MLDPAASEAVVVTHASQYAGVWVAEADGVVVALLALNGDWIEQMYVDPDYWGRRHWLAIDRHREAGASRRAQALDVPGKHWRATLLRAPRLRRDGIDVWRQRRRCSGCPLRMAALMAPEFACPERRLRVGRQNAAVGAVCIFCRIISGDAPAFVVAEDDLTVAFLDRGRATEGSASPPAAGRRGLPAAPPGRRCGSRSAPCHGSGHL